MTMANQILAHEEVQESSTTATPIRLVDRVQDLSLLGLQFTAAWIGILLIISLLWKNKTALGKWFLYLGMAVPIIISTLFLAGSTVYLNLASITGGPVHWHADFEVWACGRKLDLIDPTGLANRVGSPVFHEHGDGRIHVEGAVVDFKDVALGNFFQSVGGEIHDEHFTFPTNEKLYEYKNGDLCADGTPGVLQVFVWKIEDGEFFQQKLDNPEDYVVSPHSIIPPGDCLIIEFEVEKDQTERLCAFYQIAEQEGEIKRR